MSDFQERDLVRVVSKKHWSTPKSVIGRIGMIKMLPQKTGGRPASRILVEFDPDDLRFVGKDDLEKVEETVAV